MAKLTVSVSSCHDLPPCYVCLGASLVAQVGSTRLSDFTFIHWRRKRQPTPVFLLGEFQGQGSLVDCHLWGRTESDTTEVT